jgi:hypothetical protein
LPGLWLGGGAILANGIATFLMLTFQMSHPPACATTLIISLGVLPIWTDGLVILAAFIILYYIYWIFQRLGSTEIGIRSV